MTRTDKDIKKRYRILYKYIYEDKEHRTIYYYVKRKKPDDSKSGLTIDEIFDLQPFVDDEIYQPATNGRNHKKI